MARPLHVQMLAETLEYLEKNPDKYVADVYAQTKGGTDTYPTSARAYYRCALGTLEHICKKNKVSFDHLWMKLQADDHKGSELYHAGTRRGREAAIKYLKQIIPQL